MAIADRTAAGARVLAGNQADEEVIRGRQTEHGQGNQQRFAEVGRRPRPVIPQDRKSFRPARLGQGEHGGFLQRALLGPADAGPRTATILRMTWSAAKQSTRR